MQPTILDLLMARFNGQVLIPFPTAVQVVGINQQTARNQLSQGVFPIAVERRGGRLFIKITDLAIFVEGQPVGKKRGRPTKASKFEEGRV